MSTAINTYEILEIHNVNAATMDMAEKLVEYMQQFNRMAGLESLSIRRLTLAVDGQIVLLEDIEEFGFGNTYLLDEAEDGSPEFVGQLQIERAIWQKDSPLMQILCRVPKARYVHMELGFDIVVLLEQDYGYSYFQPLLEGGLEKQALVEHVTYKCLERYDTEPFVTSYRFVKTPEGLLERQPEFTDDLSVVEDIQTWCDGNFGCTISGSGTLCTPEEFEELVEAVQEFHSIFDNDGEEDGIGDCDETDWETYFSLNSSATYIPQEQVEQFREFLQYFYEFSFSHQADFGFEGNFTPYSQEAFARLTFVEEDGKITPKAMRY